MRRPGRHPRSKLASLARLKWLPPSILAVELQQVEGNQEDVPAGGLAPEPCEHSDLPLSSEATASPSIRQERP